jgi:hypothetical protein
MRLAQKPRNLGPERGASRIFQWKTWVKDGEMFVIQCHDPRRGNRWTFRVLTSTLQEVQQDVPFDPAAAFDALRGAIYSAAYYRMRFADPIYEQALSSDDLRDWLD